MKGQLLAAPWGKERSPFPSGILYKGKDKKLRAATPKDQRLTLRMAVWKNKAESLTTSQASMVSLRWPAKPGITHLLAKTVLVRLFCHLHI
jgi:hypothetical protein